MGMGATGLKARPRADGTTAYYWVASAIARDTKNYPLKTVRVHGTADEINLKCRTLTAELREWLSKKGAGPAIRFDGTLAGLIRLYLLTPESPYHELRSNTRISYDSSLSLLEKAVGTRRLEKVTGLDIKRWHANLKKPSEKHPEKERPRRAYQAMQLLRIVVSFGVVLNIPECFRLKQVLANLEFSVPRGRTEAMTFAQARAICDVALGKGLVSIALAQALQFELTLRQIDVIGRWEDCDDPRQGGIIDRGQRWRDGLTWSHISADGLLQKTTSKTGEFAEHDTTAYPFLRQIMDMVPQDKRFGPMIVSEKTGLPYRVRHFADIWRQCADEAGVPKEIWNRDSRAGGITEGSDSGADLEHLRHYANHRDASTTRRYNRQTLTKTRTVAKLRMALREERKKETEPEE